MKPIREYLSGLPAPYNTLALSVVDETFISYKAKVKNLYEAILYMCSWEKTPQGYGFWDKVYLHFKNPYTYSLPPIPAVEVETQSADNAQCKPKCYVKGINHDNLIVEFQKQTEDDCFEGVVVESSVTCYPIGYFSTKWQVVVFEPCDYTPAISEAIEKANQENQSKPFCGFEFSPEVEQPNNLLEIGKTFNTLSEQLNSLIQENVSLSDGNALYQDKIKDLEQENTELRADKERIVDLLNKAQITIADLESQLLSNPKELVYDVEWLAKVVKKYNEGYVLDDNCICVFHPLNRLSAKDSAPIIMAALAKELNSDWVADWEDNEQKKWRIENGYTARGYVVRASVFSFQNYRGITVFKDEETALQAIDILTQIDPQVLKNYFA